MDSFLLTNRMWGGCTLLCSTGQLVVDSFVGPQRSFPGSGLEGGIVCSSCLQVASPSRIFIVNQPGGHLSSVARLSFFPVFRDQFQAKGRPVLVAKFTVA